MKKNITEKQLLKELGIPDWRHLKHDHYIQLASSLHRLDPEVALAIINQFPSFTEMSINMVDAYKSLLTEAIASSNKSADNYYQAADAALKAIEQELETHVYSPEERIELVNLMIEISDKIANKDSENKEFLLNLTTNLAKFGLGLAAVAALILGNNLVKGEGSSDTDEEA